MDWILIVIGALGLSLWIHQAITGPNRLQRAQIASFRQLRFPSETGPLTGAQVAVIRKRQQGRDGMSSHAGTSEATDAFWYCLGPGPSWYLAIPLSTRTWGDWKIEWIVRPLDENRMRAALMGDAEALQLAFGDVHKDGLHA